MRGLADFLPGTVRIERGTIEDYRELEGFHYAPGRPATWAGIWRAVYRDRRWTLLPLPVHGEKAGERGARLASANLRACAKWPSPQPSPGVPGEGEECRIISGSTGEREQGARTVAVAVLSYPTPSCLARERELGLVGPRYGERLAFINRQVRTISRVIVHPQFRGIGLASALVRRVCEDCDTRYVESIAAMGEVHPLFEKGGMRRVGERYFLFDREREET